MLRAARHVVIKWQGSAWINVKRTRPEPRARAHMQLWQLIFPISRSREATQPRLSERWLDPSARAGEELLLLNVAGSSLQGRDGRQVGLADPPTATPAAFSRRHMKASNDCPES